MEIVLVVLFVVAALLLLVSFYKNKQAVKVEQREIDTVYMSMMEEITKLQNQIRSLELDAEITAQAVGISRDNQLLLRELLDLYKRGYTVEGIASKLNLDQEEVAELLAPYKTSKNEGRKVANEG